LGLGFGVRFGVEVGIGVGVGFWGGYGDIRGKILDGVLQSSVDCFKRRARRVQPGAGRGTLAPHQVEEGPWAGLDRLRGAICAVRVGVVSAGQVGIIH